ECEMCVQIGSGSSPDVVEIDAASNRGIDEIRVLRDNVALAPMTATYKVYIIDEVHMLTTEAANALLKTLEEPPAHVIFVLCTTEPEKLPETVVSRCSVVRFGKPSEKEMVDKLEKVAKNEELRIKNDELKMIAIAAKGSFRDGIKILEQVMMAGGDVKTVLGQVEGLGPEEFFSDMSVEFVGRLVDRGVGIRSFVERCIEYLRQKMLLGEDVIGLIERLEEVYVRTKTTAVEQLPLEIFVIQNSKSKTLNSKPEKTEPEKAGSFVATQDDKIEVKIEVKTEGPVIMPRSDYGLDDVLGRWAEVMKLIKPINHSVEALLRSTRPVDFDGEKLTLEVFYKFHKDKLESEKCRQIVEGAVASVMPGQKIRLELKMGEKMIRGSDVSGANISEDIVAAAAEIFKVDAI
ncbi:MAG: AAA family ATPase, partial [Patescibacteria group bacterium]